MKMSRGKRNVLFAGVLSYAMLFGIGNTMAYFTENSVQTNVFTTGDLDICGGCPTYTRQKKTCLGAQLNSARCEKCKTFPNTRHRS